MDGVHVIRRGFIAVGIVSLGVLLAGAPRFVGAQASKSVTVRVVDKAGYDKAIAAHKGKVVVVDCWATWCVPCRKAFPQTVELSKTYGSKGVVVVSLCFDDPVKGQPSEAVKKFLVSSNATFENLLSSVDISADGADLFEIPDGALPHFKIYGKDGKLIKTFQSGEGKEFTHEEIEAAVKAAIKTP